MRSGLQPYAIRAATVCDPGCNLMRSGLQPYAIRATTLCEQRLLQPYASSHYHTGCTPMTRQVGWHEGASGPTFLSLTLGLNQHSHALKAQAGEFLAADAIRACHWEHGPCAQAGAKPTRLIWWRQRGAWGSPGRHLAPRSRHLAPRSHREKLRSGEP